MSVHEKMTAIADAIRSKTGETQKLTLDAMAQAIPQIYGAGKQAEYDAFWDAFQKDPNYPDGNRGHYSYAFSYGGWTDTNYNPKYPIEYSSANGISNMFTWNKKVTDTKVPIKLYGNGGNAFANSSIKRIPKLIFSGATNVSNMFLGCTTLEELHCEGELAINGLDLSACTKLNRESIESVIHVLSDTTSGLSVTLSKTAVYSAFPPDTESGEFHDNAGWLSLIYSKENWTINLV